jgi:hypothetical protein
MTTPSPRRAALVLLSLAALLGTAGCVDLPANTTVSPIGKQAEAGSGADVRVWPQTPQNTDDPVGIVEGFIQTAASDPSNLSIARAYLTGDALNWHPNRVVVFSDVSSPDSVTNAVESAPGDVLVQITGTEIAKVSDDGAYQQVLDPAKDAPYTFSLSHDPVKGYRIDKLPDDDFGILLTQEAFRANYAAYYLYYLNQDSPGTSMIPVPDYQRSQAGDAATAQSLAAALLNGPPDPLAGIAEVAFPQASLAGPVTIGPDDVASVPIKTPPGHCAGRALNACRQFADELLATFSNLASVSSVQLVDQQGNPLTPRSEMDALVSRYHIAVGASKTTSFYFLDSQNHRVNHYETSSGGAANTNLVQVGPDNRKYSQLAVGSYAGQTWAAVVDDKGSKLYLAPPGTPTDSPPVRTGHSISSLTWDAFGHLWFLDTVGGVPSLYRLDLTAAPQPVIQPIRLYGLPGGTVNRVAVAPDGRRMAVMYATPGPTPGSTVYSVGIGLVDDDSPAGVAVNLGYGADKPVVYHWTSVTDVDWRGSQCLAVLGYQSSSSPLTVAELNSDGSPVMNAADLNPVTFNPPTGTSDIEWSGGALLSATKSGTGAAAQQIEQYSFAAGTWVSIASGYSPAYVN